MSEDGSGVTRITFSRFHHRIVGMDASRRYLVATRAEQDTAPPDGLGDEDKTSLWLLDLETGIETRLTDPEANAEGDSFSPDGEWIVFHMVLPAEQQADIYKIRTDGGELTRLTNTENATESDPAWSHDGRAIAFVSYGAEKRRFVLQVMDPDGHDVRTVYDPTDAVATPHYQPGVYDPSWSPDDAWIVFEKPVHYAGENGGAGIWHLLKIHPDGSGLVDLSEAGNHGNMAEYLPSFSSDGTKIVFSARYGAADPAQVRVDVFLMEADGSGARNLTNAPSLDDFATWIPASGSPGKSSLVANIRIIRQDGGRLDWSPTGHAIVFDKKNADGYYDVYTMTPDGRLLASLTDGSPGIHQRHNGDPVWHPDGDYIVFKSEEPSHYAVEDKWLSDPGIGLFSNLWATTPAGDRFWQLTDIPIKQSLGDGIPAMGVLFPRFSHDGARLAWSERYDKCPSQENCRWGRWRIKMADFVVGSQGPTLENERTVFTPQRGNYVVAMAFSPEDTKLLLAGNLDGQDEYGMDLYLFDLETGTLQNLLNTEDIWEEGSCWSPSGEHIVYMTNIGSPIDFDKDWTEQRITREYWIMDADGSHKAQLTYFNDPEAPEYLGKPVLVAQCSFSPDGRFLVGILGVDEGTETHPKVQLKTVRIEFTTSL